MLESLSEASVHAMGANTYRSMADYWPDSSEVFAEPMNRIPKGVFSRTLNEGQALWGPVTICTGDTRAELARLALDARGPVFVHGGIKFMRSLTSLDAVDEYRLVIGPWIRGSGVPLFQGRRRQPPACPLRRRSVPVGCDCPHLPQTTSAGLTPCANTAGRGSARRLAQQRTLTPSTARTTHMPLCAGRLSQRLGRESSTSAPAPANSRHAHRAGC